MGPEGEEGLLSYHLLDIFTCGTSDLVCLVLSDLESALVTREMGYRRGWCSSTLSVLLESRRIEKYLVLIEHWVYHHGRLRPGWTCVYFKVGNPTFFYNYSKFTSLLRFDTLGSIH
jgi:hypothetical protein